jgi:hypothetical protein
VEASPSLTPTRDFDAALALAAVLGALISLGLLWADGRSGSTGPGEATEIASLTFSASEVRRRPDGNLVWDSVHTGASLYERDSVFVPPGGSARIDLGGDTVLELEENSLIVLERNLSTPDARPSVQLVQGGVSGSAGDRGLSIRGGGGVVELSKRGEAHLTRDGDRSEIAVFSGSATVENDGRALTLKQNQRSDLQKLAASPLGRVELRLPSRNAKIYYQGVARVALQWNGETLPEGRLEVARDRRFTQRLALPSTRAGSGAHVFASSEPGVYWWRVVGEDGKAASETRSFVLVAQQAPVLISPAWSEVVDYAVTGALPFSWSAVTGATRYRIQIASTPDFSRPSIDRVLKGTQLRYQGPLDEGRYHWRVRPELAEGAATWSTASSFRLILKPLPQAPELIDSRVEVRPASK